MAGKKEGKSSGSRVTKLLLSMIGLLIAIPILKTLMGGEPLAYILPNMLLFTGFREEARSLWKQNIKTDMAVKRFPTHVPIIDYKDYSFESLKVATDNFRYPAIVRGMFHGTPALEKWTDVEYLSSRIGDFTVPVVLKALYGTLQNERGAMPFREAFTDIVMNEDSKKYLFFPVASRQNFNHSNLGTSELLKNRVNEVVTEDLELDRIFKGFSGPDHKTFYGSQLVIGRGTNTSEETTGTGWHCAVGSNYFAQVAGMKRWYFMDPVHSALMYPLRGGKVNMMAGNPNLAEVKDQMPIRYADVIAGDLLFNPDWEWHTIQNYEGLSIGVPIRELSLPRSLRNNFQYTAIVLINLALEKVGLSIGGYPPA